MGNNSVWKALTGASFLLVLIGLLIFLYAQSFTPSGIFPKDTTLWNNILTGYLVIFSIAMIGAIAIVPEVVKSLATANYWKSFGLKFIPQAIVGSIILILLQGILRGVHSINIMSAIAYMPISVLLVHLFVVTQIEELLFGGLIFTSIDKKYGQRAANIITIGLFAIFHYAKTGGNWLIMLTYIPLRYWFNYVRNNGTPSLNNISPIMFGATPRTQQANCSWHFVWNMFVLGFVKPMQI